MSARLVAATDGIGAADVLLFIAALSGRAAGDHAITQRDFAGKCGGITGLSGGAAYVEAGDFGNAAGGCQKQEKQCAEKRAEVLSQGEAGEGGWSGQVFGGTGCIHHNTRLAQRRV